MNLRSRIEVPLPLAVALLWLPFFVLVFYDPWPIPYNLPWYRYFPEFVYFLCGLFYLPMIVLGVGMRFPEDYASGVVLCGAQSALLTWLLFRSRVRRAARLRLEGEAGKVEP